MITLSNKQSGATLMVALIFLVMMTMFAVSSINLSSVNLRIVSNMQSVKQMEASVQDAIEQVITQSANFDRDNQSTGTTYTSTTPNSVFFAGDTTLTVTGPTCIDSREAVGYTAVVDDIIPQDNIFQVNASIVDSVTGATVSLSQGIGVRMLAGNCRDAPACSVTGNCGGF